MKGEPFALAESCNPALVGVERVKLNRTPLSAPKRSTPYHI
jgi:hypothetical protein